MSDQTIDPRALQLAESRYRNGYGPTVAEAWEQISDSLREFLINEAASWMQAAVAAGIALPAESPTAAVGPTTDDLPDRLEAVLTQRFTERIQPTT